jgi:hypothetical protein
MQQADELEAGVDEALGTGLSLSMAALSRMQGFRAAQRRLMHAPVHAVINHL